MQRFGRILVVLDAHDPSGGVIQELLQFARANAAAVTLAGTCETPDPSLLASLFGGKDHRDRLHAEVARSLDVYAAPLRDAGIHVACEVVEGDPLDGICALAASGRFDLVAKFAEGNAPDTPFTFGPLDRGLLRVCPVPVLITNPHKEETPRVLVALDVSTAVHDALNRQLMTIASGQAALFRAELHVVHAWRLVGETAFRTGAFTEVSARDLESLKETERLKRHQAVQTLLRPHRGSELTIVEHLVEGPPPKAIAAVAKTTDADLLVMGATPRSRFASMMLGDCAVAVLGAVKCSVLLVKSPDLAEELKAEA